MPLADTAIIVVCDHPETATALVQAITAANGDTVFAANAQEAAQRLKQFNFAGAVLAWQPGLADVAKSITAKSIPLCILTDGKDSVPPEIEGAEVSAVDDVVESLAALIRRPTRCFPIM